MNRYRVQGDLPGETYGRLIDERLREVVRRRDERSYYYRTLWLPLADDGAAVDMVIGCQLHRERT